MSKELFLQEFAEAYEHLMGTASQAAQLGVTQRRDGWGPREIVAHLAHELRNEAVAELTPDLVGKSRAELDAPPVRDGRNSGMESKKGRRWEEVRNSQEQRP
jgi:hypothetical protein